MKRLGRGECSCEGASVSRREGEPIWDISGKKIFFGAESPGEFQESADCRGGSLQVKDKAVFRRIALI